MSAFWRRFYLQQFVILAVSGVLLALLFHFTRLDLLLADAWYQSPARAWPIRHAWWAETLIHYYFKIALIAAALACLGIAWKRRRKTDALRWRLVACSAIIIPNLVTLGKRTSAMHCPWNIARYGGNAPYFDAFSAAPAGLPGMGHCFPAGFVSVGGWLLAFALFYYPEHRQRSRAIGAAALLVTFGMGFLQQMRGAHFLSHVLWTVWLSWAVVIALHAALGLWRSPRPQAA